MSSGRRLDCGAASKGSQFPYARGGEIIASLSPPRVSICRTIFFFYENFALMIRESMNAERRIPPAWRSKFFACLFEVSWGKGRNPGGFNLTSRFDVLVLTPPVFSQLPTDVIAAEGSTAVFQCRTTTPASVAWLKGDQGLRQGGRISIDITEGTLVISEVTPSDEGAYVCLARNNDGVASTQANLAVHGEIK